MGKAEDPGFLHPTNPTIYSSLIPPPNQPQDWQNRLHKYNQSIEIEFVEKWVLAAAERREPWLWRRFEKERERST